MNEWLEGVFLTPSVAPQADAASSRGVMDSAPAPSQGRIAMMCKSHSAGQLPKTQNQTKPHHTIPSPDAFQDGQYEGQGWSGAPLKRKMEGEEEGRTTSDGTRRRRADRRRLCWFPQSVVMMDFCILIDGTWVRLRLVLMRW